MKFVKKEPLRFKTAGWSVEDRLSVDPGPARCGELVGLGFWHDHGGGWVLSYEDFDAIVTAVALARNTEGSAAVGRRRQKAV